MRAPASGRSGAARSGRSRTLPGSRCDTATTTWVSVVSGFSWTVSSPKGRRGSDIADVVLPAYRREAAGLASPHVVRRRRELSPLDRLDGVREPLLGLRQHLGAVGR